MLKADQGAVIHEANIQMARLRDQEILYFSNFFTSFGTQSALIIAFIICNISQVQSELKEHMHWFQLLWITSAVTFASAMYVFVSCFLISVYGQGLALRGPTGSMVKAVEGMVIEQKVIVNSFNITIFFLGLNIMGNCGIMMTYPFAMVSSFIIAGGMIGWYHGTLRIYNRFQYTSHLLVHILKDFSSHSYESGASCDGDVMCMEGYLTMLDISNYKQSPSSLTKSNDNSGCNNDNNCSSSSSGSNITDNNTKNTNSSNIDSINIIKKAKQQQQQQQKHSNKWVRRYIVLKYGRMYFYTDRESYQFKSHSSLNRRSIMLTNYSIQNECTDRDFTLILSPQDEDADNQRVWEFRCDTMEELNKWKTAFTDATFISRSRRNSMNKNTNNNNTTTTNTNDISTAITNINHHHHHHHHYLDLTSPIRLSKSIFTTTIKNSVANTSSGSLFGMMNANMISISSSRDNSHNQLRTNDLMTSSSSLFLGGSDDMMSHDDNHHLLIPSESLNSISSLSTSTTTAATAHPMTTTIINNNRIKTTSSDRVRDAIKRSVNAIKFISRTASTKNNRNHNNNSGSSSSSNTGMNNNNKQLPSSSSSSSSSGKEEEEAEAEKVIHREREDEGVNKV